MLRPGPFAWPRKRWCNATPLRAGGRVEVDATARRGPQLAVRQRLRLQSLPSNAIGSSLAGQHALNARVGLLGGEVEIDPPWQRHYRAGLGAAGAQDSMNTPRRPRLLLADDHRSC
ncbi:MAG: hypothetical protein HS113_00815 [Verrucomicrobiales bacterium]|nr:hypothetical protein [Verrucomicrobiales bacterium]